VLALLVPIGDTKEVHCMNFYKRVFSTFKKKKKKFREYITGAQIAKIVCKLKFHGKINIGQRCAIDAPYKILLVVNKSG
jgi:hypothetical protein